LAPSFAPAGSTLMMSSMDLVTFARAMVDGGVGPNGGSILSAESAARMAEPTTEFVSTPSQWRRVGLGWMILPGGLLNHGGSGPGVYSELYAHPKSQRVLALLRNCDRGGALDPAIVDPIVASWTGLKRPTPPLRLSNLVDTTAYEGTYENVCKRLDVISRDGGLALRVTDRLTSYDNM